jgi:[ribosomal protein S18]-alanine N-acetyltransferase
MDIKTYDSRIGEDPVFTLDRIAAFLHKHLDQFGDPVQHIRKAIGYAMGEDGRPGGFVNIAIEDGDIIGAVVVNRTGMEGYIPENILVYIAVDRSKRGRGAGKKLMQAAMAAAEGAVALHVEPDNPARYLYEKLGFTNKYLEMRWYPEA